MNQEMPTLIERFYEWEQDAPDKPFLRQPFGNKWETYTWKQVGTMARKVATALRGYGLKDKAHIGLVSKNCREWVIADLAIMMAGYVSVPLYPNLDAKQNRRSNPPWRYRHDDYRKAGFMGFDERRYSK